MSKFKNLSGKDIVKILSIFNFEVFSQTGSHIKLRRNIEMRSKDILIIPNHKSIDKGLLKAIFKQASIYVSEVELRDYFYTE